MPTSNSRFYQAFMPPGHANYPLRVNTEGSEKSFEKQASGSLKTVLVKM